MAAIHFSKSRISGIWAVCVDVLTTAVFLSTTTGRGHAGDIGIVSAAASMLMTMLITSMLITSLLSNGRFVSVAELVRAGTYMLRLGSAT